MKSFNEFYAKFNDFVNSRFNLGEKIENSRVVRIFFKIIVRKILTKSDCHWGKQGLGCNRGWGIDCLFANLWVITPSNEEKLVHCFKTAKESQQEFYDKEVKRWRGSSYCKKIQKISI